MRAVICGAVLALAFAPALAQQKSPYAEYVVTVTTLLNRVSTRSIRWLK